MSEDEEYTGPVIELGIHMQYDAKSQYKWIKVPPTWDAMTKEEREKYCEKRAKEYFFDQLEWSHQVHSSPDEAHAASSDYWGSQFSIDQLEENGD